MSRRVFVDTSALIALWDAKDERHSAATNVFRDLGAQRRSLLLSRDVFGETVTLLRKRAGHACAVQAGDALRASSIFRLVHPAATELEAAWILFRRFHDQHFSFVDCISFAVMRSLRMREAFTFDSDFRRAGFVTLPAP